MASHPCIGHEITNDNQRNGLGPLLEQKTDIRGQVGFVVETFEKLLRSLKALGVRTFRMEYADELAPVKISGYGNDMDLVTGAITPARVA